MIDAIDNTMKDVTDVTDALDDTMNGITDVQSVNTKEDFRKAIPTISETEKSKTDPLDAQPRWEDRPDLFQR